MAFSWSRGTELVLRLTFGLLASSRRSTKLAPLKSSKTAVRVRQLWERGPGLECARAPGQRAAVNALNCRLDTDHRLTLCHFQHFDLLLRGGAHFLNRGQDGRQRLDESLFQALLYRASGRTGPSTTRRTHPRRVFTRSPRQSQSTTNTDTATPGRSREPQRRRRSAPMHGNVEAGLGGRKRILSSVVEDAADVFSVNRAGEVGVTVMPPVSAGCTDPLKKTQEYRKVSVDPKNCVKL
ncbi:hypothetical protein EYF80_023401 [Liparis tanakae]|uniref:Uncharacterized protein n=1 Tax=Liparis tanakae TaxID=230148 RepID=A0A4Z2HNM3_9TELE|nr:hypothetical protein EYF80_023401 [Liparis tanakae]